LCAPCHSRRTQLGDYDHTERHLMDDFVPALLEENLYFADGQILDEVYVYGSFVQSKMFRNDVRCSDCHDVHSLKLVQEGNALCLQCHQAEVYDSYDHHFHKKEYEGKPSDGHLCVKCHMRERPYMVVDWRADHSLRVPRPDLTLKTGLPNACEQSGCHNDKTDAWTAEHYAKWYGLARKPHYGTVIAAGRDARPDARDALVRLIEDTLHPAIVRATALALLERYPGVDSAGVFNRALADDDPLIRHTAVDRVVPSTPEEFEELLAPLLFDPVKVVRMQAASRLAGLPEGLLKPYQREALARAVAEYKEAMEYSLDFAFAAHNLGNLYVKLREPEVAEEYYRTALEIDDLFYPAKANLAVLYNAQGRNDEAERLLREILDAYPDQYDAAYSLGLLLAEMKRYDEAAEFLEQAAGAAPERGRAFYNLGLALEAAGRIEEGGAALRRAADLEPANFDYLYVLADHYARRGELEKALTVATKLMAAHPGNATGRELTARIENALRSGSAD
jgi:predicted CXXCH cytochrome family protein